MSVKARDLRVAVKDMGFEKGMLHTLELTLEELNELKQHQRQLTELVDMCIRQVDMMVQFGDAMKGALEELRRVANQEGLDET
jgi:hypothetical protein